jgi:hypothetical protein
MKKRIPILGIILFCSYFAYSQYDFRTAYYVTKTSDTIHGYVNFNGHYKPFEHFIFKKDLNSGSVILNENDAVAVRFKNEGYFVPLKVDEKVPSKLFVEQLIEGIVDIFCYRKNREIHYLIREENGKLYKLTNTKRKLTKEGVTYEQEIKEYLGVLHLLFQNSPSSLNRLKTIKLSSESLVDISLYYHNDVCDDYNCIVYSKNKIKFKLDFGVTAGYSVTAISFSKNKWVGSLNSDFSQSKTPAFGFLLNISEPSVSRRFSLQIETNYQQDEFTTDTTSLSITYLKVPLLTKYTFPIKTLEPSLQFGVSYNRFLSVSDEGIVPEIQNNSVIQKNRYQYGILFGADVSSKISANIDFFLQGRYEIHSGDHYNNWILFGGFTPVRSLDHVRSNTNVVTISGGIKF